MICHIKVWRNAARARHVLTPPPPPRARLSELRAVPRFAGAEVNNIVLATRLFSSRPAIAGRGDRALARWEGRQRRRLLCNASEVPMPRPPPPCYAWSPSPAARGRMSLIVLASRFFSSCPAQAGKGDHAAQQRGGRGGGVDDCSATQAKCRCPGPLHHATHGPPPPLRGDG